MWYGLFLSMYVLLSLLLALIILVQRSKGSAGFGAFSGGTQLFFGGSGGQDILQKTTWLLGALFLASSLLLALGKAKQAKTFRYLNQSVSEVAEQRAAVPDNSKAASDSEEGNTSK